MVKEAFPGQGILLEYGRFSLAYDQDDAVQQGFGLINLSMLEHDWAA